LALVPQGQAVGRAGFVAAPNGSPSAVTGRTYAPVSEPDARCRVHVGEDGISVVDGLSIAAVRYRECVALLAWSDGARLLYGPDAVVVCVEHRLFSPITMNWRGRPLTSHEVIVASIAATTTCTGLTVHAELDTSRYPTGLEVSNAQIAAVAMTRHRFHGDWNYTLALTTWGSIVVTVERWFTTRSRGRRPGR